MSKCLRNKRRLTQNSGGHTQAVILCDIIHLVLGVDGIVVSQFEHLLEGIIDEDEAYETGETFLGEPGEVLNQEARVSGHKRQAEERRPQADPQAELQVVKLVVSVWREKTKSTQHDKYWVLFDVCLSVFR